MILVDIHKAMTPFVCCCDNGCEDWDMVGNQKIY